MREDVDLFCIASKDQTQRVFEFIACRRRAIRVVDVIRHGPPRGPGEKDWYSRRVCVIHDLCEAIESFREHRVVAVDENERSALSGWTRGQLGVEGFDEFLFAVEICGVTNNEIRFGITWRPRRPFYVPGHMPWRHSHGHRCV